MTCASLVADAQTVVLTPTANDLYNTGFSGTVLAGSNQADTHYALTNFGPGQSYQADPLAGGWAANTANTQWITVSPLPAATDESVPGFPPTNPPSTPPGTPYDYRLTLTNIPSGRLVTITGMISADDGVSISVNGAAPFYSNAASTTTPANFQTVVPIPPVTFISGTNNTIDFMVNNVGGLATGLFTELTGSYTVLTSTVGLGIQIMPVNLTPNQQAVISNINQLNSGGVNNACFTNLTASLLGLGSDQIGQALDQLSPEKLNIFSSIAFNNATFMTQNLDDYLAHRRTPEGHFASNPGGIESSGLTVSDPTLDSHLSPIYSHLLAWSPPAAPSGLMSDTGNPLLTLSAPTHPDHPWNVFIQGNVILGQDFSDQDLAHENATTSAVELGADYQLTPNFLMGAFFNFNHSDANLDEMGSSATVDSYAPGIYASCVKGGWYGNFLASYSHNVYTEERDINIADTYLEKPNGATEGDQETVNLDGGYDFHDKDKKWTYGPTLGLQYVHMSVDHFVENGGCSANLAVSSQSADSFRSRMGGHVSYATKADGMVLTPFLDASWQHEYLDGQRAITASFSDITPSTFTVFTPALGRESALLATGLNIDLDDAITVFTNYDVQVTPDDYLGQSVLAGLKLAF